MGKKEAEMPLDDVGAAAAAIDTSIPSDGGAGAVEAPVTDVQTDDVTGGTPAAIEATPAEQSQPTPAETQVPLEVTPGQSLPQQFRSLFKNPDPEVAKLAPQIQSMWDRLQAYTTHFPTVADAKEFTSAFPGGVKEAVAAQQRAMELDEVDNAYFSRDPEQHASLARDWSQNDPEAFATMVRASAGVLSQSNPQEYQKVGQEILEGTLHNLYRTALGVGNQEAATRIDQLMKDVFGRGVNEAPKADPRDQQFKQREAEQSKRESEFQNRVAADFATGANQAAGRQLQTQIQSNLATALKNLKVSDGAKGKIAEEIYNDINQKLIADRALQTRLQSIAQAGRRNGFSDQQRAQWSDAIIARAKALLPTSAKSVIDQWTQDYLGVVKANNDKATSAGQRKDVGGGGPPDQSLTPLTGDKIFHMTDKEFSDYKGPIHPQWRAQLNEAKFARRAAK